MPIGPLFSPWFLIGDQLSRYLPSFDGAWNKQHNACLLSFWPQFGPHSLFSLSLSFFSLLTHVELNNYYSVQVGGKRQAQRNHLLECNLYSQNRWITVTYWPSRSTRTLVICITTELTQPFLQRNSTRLVSFLHLPNNWEPVTGHDYWLVADEVVSCGFYVYTVRVWCYNSAKN